MMLLVDYKYKFKLFDRNLCFVEYDPAGMSRNILKQYYNSPNSFAALRIKILSTHCFKYNSTL